MSWLMNLEDSFLPLVGTFLGIFVTGLASIVTMRRFVTDSPNSKRNKLQDIVSIKDRQDLISKSNKFIQDLEVTKVPSLENLSWLEVKAILRRDIGINTVKNLNYLASKQLIALDGNKIILPNKGYVLLEHLKNPKSIFIALAFISSFLWLIYLVLVEINDEWLFSKVLILTGLLEVLMVLGFEDYIIISQMKDESLMNNNDIYISENFKNSLASYKVFNTNYYSVNRLQKIENESESSTNN